MFDIFTHKHTFQWLKIMEWIKNLFLCTKQAWEQLKHDKHYTGLWLGWSIVFWPELVYCETHKWLFTARPMNASLMVQQVRNVTNDQRQQPVPPYSFSTVLGSVTLFFYVVYLTVCCHTRTLSGKAAGCTLSSLSSFHLSMTPPSPHSMPLPFPRCLSQSKRAILTPWNTTDSIQNYAHPAPDPLKHDWFNSELCPSSTWHPLCMDLTQTQRQLTHTNQSGLKGKTVVYEGWIVGEFVKLWVKTYPALRHPHTLQTILAQFPPYPGLGLGLGLCVCPSRRPRAIAQTASFGSWSEGMN